MLVDYMTITMLHQLITNTIQEINAVFKEHTIYLPKKILTDSNEDEEQLNEVRPEGAPQVRIVNKNNSSEK